MSKLNQIQTELKGIDQAKFQKLCDAYLHKHGYDRVNPLGVVIGADKVVKGTPDTFISLPTGRYVFAEYTTQQEGVFKKQQPQNSTLPLWQDRIGFSSSPAPERERE